MIARAQNYLTVSQCSSLKTAIGLPQCDVIFLHVHFSNDAKTLFGLTFLFSHPGSRYVCLCLAKDGHLRRLHSVKIQLLPNDIRP